MEYRAWISGPSQNRPNLSILTDSRVDKIIFAGSRAVGVQWESFSIHGEEIILACGAIGSPHLLMLSGVGPANHLTHFGIPVVHNSPGVGQNLRDHPQVPVMFHTRYPLDENFETHGIQVLLRYTAAGSKQRNDMLIHPFAQSGRSLYYSRNISDPRSYGMVACLYLAEGSGTLSLMSPDPHIQPFLNYNYLVTDWDRSRLRESVRICIKIAQQKGMSQIILSPMDPTESDIRSDDLLDAWLLANVRTSHHISGTCKMGPTYDNMSVVDQFGKVHGVSGLRVADASIMPDCVRANTNVTTMVIGERIAEFVQEGN